MKIAKNSQEALRLLKKSKKGDTIMLDERQKNKPRIECYLVCNNCGKQIGCMNPYNCCSKKCAKEYLKKCKKIGRWL